jgi:hypothetical protein
LGSTAYTLTSTSYVFWAETGAASGGAVSRSTYTTSFGSSTPLWSGSGASFLNGAAAVTPSNDVVGVAYYSASTLLFAATYSELYATSGAITSSASSITWYRMAGASSLTFTTGLSRVNSFRGVAFAPKTCTAGSPVLPFRQLLEGSNSTAGALPPLIL